MSDEANRDGAGRWVKGKSGNPGGQLKRIHEIRALALSETEASFRVLFEIRDSTASENRDRIAACKEIIRYGIGEPPKRAEQELPTGDEMGGLTLDELRDLARQSLAEEAPDGDDDADDDSDGRPH